MKGKKTFFIAIVILFLSIPVLTSCAGCTKTGRERLLVKMAQEESLRPSTDPEPNISINDENIPESIKIADVVTPDEEVQIEEELEDSKIPPAQGELVQIEGLVAKEMMELLIALETNDDQVDQILQVQHYVQQNWKYVYDPDIDRDTWRSAEATIALKYRGTYTGDCDDFAILMASFAKQIGLQAQVVGGFDNNGSGHAFALFRWPYSASPEAANYRGLDLHKSGNETWVSMDWFKGREHYQFEELTVLIDSNGIVSR